MEYSKIEKLREQKKISKMKLCRMANITTPTYYDMISGKSIPSVAVLESVSAALGVSPSIWWKDDIDIKSIAAESEVEYMKNCSNCNRYIKEITQQQDHIDLLMEQLGRKKNTSAG